VFESVGLKEKIAFCNKCKFKEICKIKRKERMDNFRMNVFFKCKFYEIER